MSVPQVDAVTVNAVKDGKLVDVVAMQIESEHGPEHAGHGRDRGDGRAKGEHGDAPQADDDDDDDDNEKEVVAAITEARKKSGKKPTVPLNAPIPPTAAEGESLAEYLAGKKPVVNADLGKAEGQIMKEMRKRGAKSSLHIPAAYDGQPLLISFWSRDPDAFPAPAQAALAGVVQIMTAPKNAEAQASTK
jgi:hypothetical protein